MPLISTGTMGSNKSFGFSRGRLKVLTTFNFPAGTSTWTAPAGVTSLTSAVGKGANGSAPSWYSSLPFISTGTAYQASGSATLTGETITSELNTMLSWANSLSSTTGTSTSLSFIYYNWSSSNSVWGRMQNNYAGLYRKTTPSIQRSGSHPASGPVTPGSGGLSRILGVQAFDPGSDGTATTGFSLTFAGGSAAFPTATDTTFNSVAVTPGTTYTIVNNNSLTITYYV